MVIKLGSFALVDWLSQLEMMMMQYVFLYSPT